MKQTLFFNNKTAKYVGEVKDGLMHGKGTYTYKDGSIFKGSWKNGVMHGKGVFQNAFYFSDKTIDGKYVGADGGPLTGLFKKGKPHGVFKWKMKSGRTYVGRIIVYSDGERIDIGFNGRGTLKAPGRGGLVQKGIWENGELIKEEKSKSAYINFITGINKKNLLNDRKYYVEYLKKALKIDFSKGKIFSLKELPYKKDRIKLALKRLIMFAAMFEKEEHEWFKKNLGTIEELFLKLASFQRHKTKNFNESSRKIKNLYNKELKAFNEYIEFCSEKYFKYPKKLYAKLRERENKKLNEKKC